MAREPIKIRPKKYQYTGGIADPRGTGYGIIQPGANEGRDVGKEMLGGFMDMFKKKPKPKPKKNPSGY